MSLCARKDKGSTGIADRGRLQYPLAQASERPDHPLGSSAPDAGRNFVYVQAATGFVRQDVELGLQSPARVEVVSGLTAGHRVALRAPDNHL